MQLRQGVATKVRNTSTVLGTDSQVATVHVVTCEMNGRIVQISTAQPPFIEDGDNIKVSGFEKNGIFNGLAYNNLTKACQGNCGGIPLFVGIMGIVISGGVPMVMALAQREIIFMLAGIGMSLVGISISGFMLSTSLKTRKAVKLVES